MPTSGAGTSTRNSKGNNSAKGTGSKGSKSGSKSQAISPGFSPLYTLPGGNYDVNKLYMESTDSKGHYEQVNIKFPPHVETLIQNALRDNPLYRSSQAFIRDAIIHRLWYVANNPGSTIDPVMIEMELTRQLMKQEMEVDRQMRADVDSFLDAVELMVSQDASERADILCDRMRITLQRPELWAGHREMITSALEQAEDMMANPRKRVRRPS